jgi:cAMP-dependent protein kinase regulator
MSTMNNFLFHNLDDKQETGMLNAMCKMQVEVRQVIICQKDIGDYFYVIESSLLHYYICVPESPLGCHLWGSDNPLPDVEDSFQYGKLIQKCMPGMSFEELTLMYSHPYTASVVMIESFTLWHLDHITFQMIILNGAHCRQTIYEQFLLMVTLLSLLLSMERSKIVDTLMSQAFKNGMAVIRQGEMGNTFFFIKEGKAKVTKTHQGDDGEMHKLVVGHPAN